MTRLIAALAVASVLASGLATGAAHAEDPVTGPAKVVDADIVMVGKQRVILWGVDAPERTQKCYVGDLMWGCYDAAKQALADLIATGDTTCTLIPGDPDKFNRRFGTCLSAGKDIGAELIRTGFARAYVEQTDMYVPQEEEAKAAQIGIFQPGAKVDAPWDWRKTDPRNYR